MSAAFNAAIFDGPVRIYFAQHQEAQALKVYFGMQNEHSGLRAWARHSPIERGFSVFIMIYPDLESFQMCFEVDEQADVILRRLESDFVIGVKPPTNESQISQLHEVLHSIEKRFRIGSALAADCPPSP